jgi:hypothetical protein
VIVTAFVILFDQYLILDATLDDVGVSHPITVVCHHHQHAGGGSSKWNDADVFRVLGAFFLLFSFY